MYIFIHTLDTTLTNIAAFTKRASKKSQQNTWPCQLKNASTSHPVNLLFDLKQSVSLNFSFRSFIIFLILLQYCNKMEWYKNVYRDVFGRTINTFTRSNYFVTLLAPNSIRSMNKICIIRRLNLVIGSNFFQFRLYSINPWRLEQGPKPSSGKCLTTYDEKTRSPGFHPMMLCFYTCMEQ